MTRISSKSILIFSILGLSMLGTLSLFPTQISFGQENKNNYEFLTDYGNNPQYFEQNQGQIDDKVHFVSRGTDYALFLTQNESILSLRNSIDKTTTTLTINLANSNPSPNVIGLDELEGKSNYLLGNDSNNWYKNIPHYSKVMYEDIYDGIDLIYYGNQKELEFDFVVAPYTDPNIIKLNFDGYDAFDLDNDGNLIFYTSSGKMIQHSPVIYQMINGEKNLVSGKYIILENNLIGFDIDSFDSSIPLIIDPILDFKSGTSFSTFLGGTEDNEATGMKVDSDGNSYITGYTDSIDYPLLNPFQNELDVSEAFVTKLDSNGNLVFSTFLGGGGSDFGTNLEIDSNGNVYVVGITQSTDFPTVNPIQSSYAGNTDNFISKLNSDGDTLIFSTYLGGSARESSIDIALGPQENVHVGGITASSDFPTVSPLYPSYSGGGNDGYIAKLNAAGSQLLFSTYLGGNGVDRINDIEVDQYGNVYVIGDTSSTDFPLLFPVQSELNGRADLFVTKISAGFQLLSSTYYGGSGFDSGRDIAIIDDTPTSYGNIFVVGTTDSTDLLPENRFRVQPEYGGGPSDIFIVESTWASGDASAPVRIDSDGTYWGGSGGDTFPFIAVDSAGSVYITGQTTSTDLRLSDAVQKTHSGGIYDIFVAKFDRDLDNLSFSTYFGGDDHDQPVGIGIDSNKNVYVAGTTLSLDFPILDAIQPTFTADDDHAFIFKLGNLENDFDQDAIFNEIDLESFNPTVDFSDESLGGKTTGTIISKGEQNLSIRDAEDPTKGIVVKTSSLSGTLIGLVGDGGDDYNSLYSISLEDGSRTRLCEMPLGDGTGDGETIAFNSGDGFLYRGSGGTSGGGTAVLTRIDDVTTNPCTVTHFSLADSENNGEARSLTYWPAQNEFIWTDDWLRISPQGIINFEGPLSSSQKFLKGVAFDQDGTLYSILRPCGTESCGGAEISQVNPVDGAIVLDGPPVTLDDEIINQATGLARDPETGEFFALLNLKGQFGRELVTLDPVTGIATSIGDTGEKFAGITFIPAQETLPAKINICDEGEQSFDYGIEYVATCGNSFTIDVLLGPILIEYTTEDGSVVTTTLTKDNHVTFETTSLSITNNGLTDVEVLVNGVTVVIPAGEIYDPSTESVSEKLDALKAQVDDSIEKKKDAKKLTKKLDKVSKELGKDKLDKACKELGKFIKDVKKLEKKGKISDGTQLKSAAEDIKDAIGCS